MKFIRRQHSSNKPQSAPISSKQKRTIDRAVKKTIKEYGKTLELLSKT